MFVQQGQQEYVFFYFLIKQKFYNQAMENKNSESNSISLQIAKISPMTQKNAYFSPQKFAQIKKLSHNNQIGLSNILELTQEYQQQKTISSKVKNSNQADEKEMNEKKQEKKNFLSRILRKTIHCLHFTYNKIYSRFSSEEVNVAESQLSQMLTKLRKKKDRKIRLLPQLSSSEANRKTLVLDLDQTLVSLSHRKPKNYDFQIEVQSKGYLLDMYITKRFGLDSFLFEMSQIYQLVIFSSLKNDLVEQIISHIDPKRYISHYLSREHCVIINQTYFIKPVRDLGRDSHKVIAVDSYSISASLNPENLYKIQRFKGSSKDRKLIKLSYFLKYLHENLQIQDIVPIEKYRKQFETKQIQINDKQNMDRQKEQRILSHRKRNSEVESILPKQQESAIEVLSNKI